MILLSEQAILFSIRAGFWVLLLSTLLPSNLMDAFTLSKFFAVCLRYFLLFTLDRFFRAFSFFESIAGCIMVSVSEKDKPNETENKENVLSAWVIPFAIASLL